MTADRDDLAAILDKHQRWTAGWTEYGMCICGERFPREGFRSDINRAHSAHVAQMVLESDWLRDVKAQAAQDERDRMLKPWPGEWVIHDGCDDAPEVRHYHVGDRCPYRADRVEDEDGGGE